MGNMVILQEIDKCVKCRACQVACQRGQGLGTTYGDAEKVQFDDPVVMKAQAANDSPPFVRYSCWHCNNAPCVPDCPFDAMKQDATLGMVYVDHALCDPANPLCTRQCVTNCGRGGYPKVGTADHGYKAYKCNMCIDLLSDESLGALGEGIRKPRCVATCPNKALTFASRTEVDAILATYPYKAGNGHVYWASKKPFNPPTTDPFIEDHISPMFGSMTGGSLGKALAVPSIAVGALYALYRRRLEVSGEGKKA